VANRRFGSAVRDAFIYLDDVLREVGNIGPATGPSGDRLVTRELGPPSSSVITLPTDGFIRGELEGVYNYVKGAFLLFRNAPRTARSRTQPDPVHSRGGRGHHPRRQHLPSDAAATSAVV
jgi:hypothetical protein